MTRSFGYGAFVLLLAACDMEVPPQVCDLPASAPTADTALAFQVDGRQVLLDSAAFSYQVYYYTPGDFVEILAGVKIEDDYQALSIRLVPFHGAGAYPVYAGSQGVPQAFTSYTCTTAPREIWVGNAEVPDTVYVTAYDSVTSAISGTFHFTVTGYYHGDVMSITNGAFHGFAPKPSASEAGAPRWGQFPLPAFPDLTQPR